MVFVPVVAALRIQDDAEVSSLRTEVVGKRIWLYGATIACGPNQLAVWDPREPVTVRSVRREPDRFYPSDRGKRDGLLYHAVTPWDTGGNWGPVIPWLERTIRVEVRLPPSRANGAADSMLARPFRKWPYPSPEPSVPETVSFTVASREELWRFATSASPWGALGRTSDKVRNAFARRDLALGMPRALVALVLADPDPGATRSEVWARREWSYEGGTLDSYLVVFDAHDRVASFGVQWAKWP